MMYEEKVFCSRNNVECIQKAKENNKEFTTGKFYFNLLHKQHWQNILRSYYVVKRSGKIDQKGYSHNIQKQALAYFWHKRVEGQIRVWGRGPEQIFLLLGDFFWP